MNDIRSYTLPILVFSGLLTAIKTAPAAAASAAPTIAPYVYPQIVRLSYIEGDVRISRGKPADKIHEEGGMPSTGWEQAAADLPIASGYSVVTGAGRAEIEFEDASTVYLADNSVLAFDNLSSASGVPYTELSLLSGRATLNVHVQMPGEIFRVITPTDHMALTYPRRAVWRIDSYLDAISITPLEDLTIRQPGMTASAPQVLGKTASYKHGNRILTSQPSAEEAAANKEWDQWVATRMEVKNAAMSAAMKDAGLSTPIPGLDQLNGQGHFFACAPYGTCWEPTNGWTGKPAEVVAIAPQPTGSSAMPGAQPALATPAEVVSALMTPAPPAAAPSAPIAAGAPRAAEPIEPVLAAPQLSGAVKGSKAPKPSATDAYLAAHPGATLRAEDYTFPCSTYMNHELIGSDPVTGRETVIESTTLPFGFSDLRFGYPAFAGYSHRGLSPFRGYDAFDDLYPWDWAVCHAGTWIRWQHHYVWVAGTKRHHHRPVRWVKTGRTTGFVPLHPRDVAGKPPINLKDGVFKLTGKNGGTLERVTYEQDKPLKLLAEAPKEFRDPVLAPLKIAEVPQAKAYSVYSAAYASTVAKAAAPGKGAAVASSATRDFAAKGQGTPIVFDRKSQSFFVSRPIVANGRPGTVAQPLGERGYQTASARGSRGLLNGGSSRAYTPSPASGGSSSRSYSPPPSRGGYSGGASAARSSGGGGGSASSRGGTSGGGSHR